VQDLVRVGSPQQSSGGVPGHAATEAAPQRCTSAVASERHDCGSASGAAPDCHGFAVDSGFLVFNSRTYPSLRDASVVGRAVCEDLVHVALCPRSEAAGHVVEREAEVGQLVGNGDGTVGVTVRVITPSRSSDRNVWVNIFWLTPASRREISE
jgi:hypothetical protein